MFRNLKEKFLNERFLKFLIIGGVNTLIAQLLYLFFVFQKIEPGISSILGDCLSVIVSYILNLKITYKRKHNWKIFFLFPLSYVPGWILNYFLVILAIYFGIPKIYAKIISLPITIPLNFILMSIIMRVKRGKNEEN